MDTISKTSNTDWIAAMLTKENILAIAGLFVLFLSLSLLAGVAWGLMVLGIGLIIWAIVVALSKKPKTYRY